MKREEIGDNPIAYTRDRDGSMLQSDDGDWVKKEHAQEILGWLKVFIHTVESGATFASLRSIAGIARKNIKDITR